MSPTKSTLRIRHLSVVAQTRDLDHEIGAFLIDRGAHGLSSGTIRFYTQKLKPFRDYLRSLDILAPEAITAPESVHPHACGEYGEAAIAAVEHYGPSPRVWGIRW